MNSPTMLGGNQLIQMLEIESRMKHHVNRVNHAYQSQIPVNPSKMECKALKTHSAEVCIITILFIQILFF